MSRVGISSLLLFHSHEAPHGNETPAIWGSVSLIAIATTNCKMVGVYPPTGTLAGGHCSERAAFGILECSGAIPTLDKISSEVSAMRDYSIV